jgi:hypothetical protein
MAEARKNLVFGRNLQHYAHASGENLALQISSNQVGVQFEPILDP